MKTLIKFENITFEYESDYNNISVFDNFSLEIEKGTFNVILGHNGSGKSTLAKLSNGLVKPTSGNVFVDGMDTSDEESETDIRKKVGLVFQNPDNQLVFSVVEEDVAFGPENLGLSPEVIRQRVDSALKSVDMYEKRTELTHKLSGGQKQRVAIAGVIAMEPECLVLDEPTAMLDPRGRREVISAIHKLNKDKGITVVLITHFMEEATDADRVIVMSEGRITADGSPRKVFSQINKLKEAGLDLPQTTDLLFKLSQNGVKTEKGVLSVSECAEYLAKLLNSEAN